MTKSEAVWFFVGVNFGWIVGWILTAFVRYRIWLYDFKKKNRGARDKWYKEMAPFLNPPASQD